jgi:hypothetical protein
VEQRQQPGVQQAMRERAPEARLERRELRSSSPPS